MVYYKSIFRTGINENIKGPVLILFVILQSCVSGITDTTASRITLFYGLNPSVVILFSQFGSIGTVAILPVYYRLRGYFRRADLLYITISGEIIVSLICLTQHNSNILLACNFLMGMLRIMCRLDILSFLVDNYPILRQRALFFGIYYAITQCTIQLYNIALVNIVEEDGWQISYLISAAAAFVSLLLCAIFFHRQRLHRKVPLYQVDWASMLLFIIAAVSFCYTLTLGQVKDWFDAPDIKCSICVFAAACIAFIYRQFSVKRPYWNLRIFGRFKQVPLGIAFMLVMYLFSSTGFIFDQYAKYNFKDGAAYLSSISLIALCTYAASFPLAGILLHKGFSKRMILFIGFLCYAVSLILFFNLIQTSLSFSNLIVPYILQGFGWGFTMTTLSTFTALNVPIKFNSDRVMSSLSFRYIIGSFAGYSLYSNWLYRSTFKNERYLAEDISNYNFAFIKELKTMASHFMSGGFESGAAEKMALLSIEQKVQLQAMLISIKDIALYAGIAAIIISIAILFIKRFEMHSSPLQSNNNYNIF